MPNENAGIRCQLKGRFPLDRAIVPAFSDPRLYKDFRKGFTVTLPKSSFDIVENYVEVVTHKPTTDKTPKSKVGSSSLPKEKPSDDEAAPAETKTNDGEES